MKTIGTLLAALCCVLLVLSCPVWAQSKEDAIRLGKEGSALEKKARSKDDLMRAAGKLEQALKIYERLRDDKGIETEAGSLGMVYGALGQYDKALEYLEECVKVSRKIGHAAMEGECLFNMGNCYERRYQSKEDMERAVEKFEKALKIYEQLRKDEQIGSTLGGLGDAYASLGQYDKAVDSYEKCLQITRDLKDRRTEGMILCNLGLVFQHRGEYNSVLENFQKGLAIWNEIKVPSNWPKALIAGAYMDTGDFARAEPLLKDANYNTSWGRFYLLKPDYHQAKEYYEKILKSAEENRNANDIFTAYTGLAEACEGLKDLHWRQVP